jgi:hypothetical protein
MRDGGDKAVFIAGCPTRLSWPPSGVSPCFGALQALTLSWSLSPIEGRDGAGLGVGVEAVV